MIWCLLKSPITIAHNVFTVRNQNGWESQVKYNFDLCYFMIQYYECLKTLGEISTSEEELKSLLMKVKEESEKVA